MKTLFYGATITLTVCTILFVFAYFSAKAQIRKSFNNEQQNLTINFSYITFSTSELLKLQFHVGHEDKGICEMLITWDLGSWDVEFWSKSRISSALNNGSVTVPSYNSKGKMVAPQYNY